MYRWMIGVLLALLTATVLAQNDAPAVSAPVTTWMGPRTVQVAWTVARGHGRRVPVATNGVIVEPEWQDVDATEQILRIEMDACTGKAQVGFVLYRRSCAWLPMVWSAP